MSWNSLNDIYHECIKKKKSFPILKPITHFPQSEKSPVLEQNQKSDLPLTKEKLLKDYLHFAGWLRAWNLEDLLLNAPTAFSSPDLKQMMKLVRQSYDFLFRNLSTDEYGVWNYVISLEKLANISIWSRSRINGTYKPQSTFYGGTWYSTWHKDYTQSHDEPKS